MPEIFPTALPPLITLPSALSSTVPGFFPLMAIFAVAVGRARVVGAAVGSGTPGAAASDGGPASPAVATVDGGAGMSAPADASSVSVDGGVGGFFDPHAAV